MNKFLLTLAAGAMLLGFSACSGEGSPLTASSAKSALKKEAIFAKDSQVRSFEIGFREVSESELDELAKLKAAGLVEFTVEQATETREYRDYSFWSGYYTYTKTIEHTFADVKLTPAGQKLVVEKPTSVRADVLKDFKANEDYEEVIPDYMSATYTATATAEDTTQIEVAEVAEAVEVEEVEADTCGAVEEIAEVIETPAEPAKAEPAKVNPNAAYEALVARVNPETVNVLVGRFEIVKVKEVLCTEDMFKAGKGSCTVLIKFVDKTPFGFVLGAPEENYIRSTSVNFIHYQDMGWTVDD